MSRTENRWADEQAWWTMGAGEALRRMHPACVMVSPQGVAQGGEVPAALDLRPRGSKVRMTERRLVETEDCIVLAYRARATGPDGDSELLCSSTWVRQKDDWLMIQHQQAAPAEDAES